MYCVCVCVCVFEKFPFCAPHLFSLSTLHSRTPSVRNATSAQPHVSHGLTLHTQRPFQLLPGPGPAAAMLENPLAFFQKNLF